MGQIVLRMLRMSEPSQLLPADGCQDLNSCGIPMHHRGAGGRSGAEEAGLPGCFFQLLGYTPSQGHHFTALSIRTAHIRFVLCPIMGRTVKCIHDMQFTYFPCPEQQDWLKSWLDYPKQL